MHAAPTIWGLSPMELHDRFWASRGVCVVRPGDTTPLPAQARFFLLLERSALLLFDSATFARVLPRVESELLYVHLHDQRSQGSREYVITDPAGDFVRFERRYDRPRHRLARAAMTTTARLAGLWQSAGSSRPGWRDLRRAIPRSHRSARDVEGMLFDGSIDHDAAELVNALVRCWNRPDVSIDRAIPAAAGAWMDRDAFVSPHSEIVAPVWIGAGRRAEPATLLIGPAVLWDAPGAATTPTPLRWNHIAAPHAEPLMRSLFCQPPAPARRLHRFSKRLFDIVFSITVILCCIPLYPLIVIAILLEDGWPFWFAHRRETLGGREFPCLKFRSMLNNAHQKRDDFAHDNQADGPQFYIPNDPRLTSTGRVLRRFHLDELLQFFNVLLGHMSVVGPRPSPFAENQYCPAWRSARLSVRPGITGLWQISRTRARGTDFQEWIRYDIEYVESACWSLDLWIIWKTLVAIVRRGNKIS